MRYEAVGLNERWRLAKYLPGDRFQSHVDAFYEDSGEGFGKGRKSMFTVNIYMNGGFEGGDTTFHLTERQSYSVKPETGLCLLFRQPHAKHYLHEGQRLESGLKYLFRSDVMYRLAPKQS